MELLNIYVIQAIHGIVYGMLLFLVASGLALVWGMMGVLNIANAAFYMLGAFLTYSIIVWSGSFWPALILAPLGVGLVGILVERFLLRKVHAFGHAHELLLTFGVFYAITEMVKWLWGTTPIPVPIPSALSGSISIMGAMYPYYRLFILFVGLAVLFALAAFIQKTRIGVIIRAAVSDGEMVEALGVNVGILFVGVFASGAFLAALAGVIAAPFLSVYAGMGLDIMIDTFVVIVIGGLGSLTGAFVAALMIGGLQSFGILFMPKLAMVFEFFLMAIILILRPVGLFGEEE
jgi:branched-chain amino acid transport system permease protein